MKKLILATAILAVAGCSSNPTTLTDRVKETNQVGGAIKERTISTEWEDDGIQISYTLTGELKEIVVQAQVPSHVSYYKAVAESEARKRIVEFVYGVDVDTDTRVEVIGTTIDKANDRSLENYIQEDGVVDADSLETDISESKIASPESGTSTERVAEAVEKTIAKETRTLKSAGRLVGWQVSGYPIDDGSVWVAELRWTEKDQKISDMLRLASQ